MTGRYAIEVPLADALMAASSSPNRENTALDHSAPRNFRKDTTTVDTLFLALGTPALVALVLGSAILWDRLREPHRDIHRPAVVVDQRTYRDARHRVERLAAEADWFHAYAGATAICLWLASERHFGSRRRKARLTSDLATWTARKAEYNPAAAF